MNNFDYQLLGRLKQDCEYYLGAGNRNRKHLWALDEVLQIQKMKELYESLTEKPTWINLEEINGYEEKMGNNQIMGKAKAKTITTSITELENAYIDAAAELLSKQAGLQNHAHELHKLIVARDTLREHPDFSGYLPETYFSGGDLDPEGATLN